MIENLLYAKMTPHLKKSINQAYLENGTYGQIVKHLEREMELNGLEADEPIVKTQMTVTKKNKTLRKLTKNQMKKRNKRLKQYPTKHSKTTNAVLAKRQAT